jgi:hypothetical protein
MPADGRRSLPSVSFNSELLDVYITRFKDAVPAWLKARGERGAHYY